MKLQFTDISEVKEDKNPFIWYPFVPKNECTILVANGGVGKTYFALDVLGRLSNGITMPNKMDAGLKAGSKTVMVSSETDPKEFTKRLTQLFGKCPSNNNCACSDVDKEPVVSSLEFGSEEESQVVNKTAFNKHLITHITPPVEMLGKDKGFADRNTRRSFMKQIADFGDKVVLFDPLKSYLGNAYASQHKLRAVMEELSQDLKEFDLTFIGIWHLNKMGKVQGTTEVKDSVRSVVRMANNLEDERVSFIQVEKANNVPTDVKENILAFDKNSLGKKAIFGLEYNPDLYDSNVTMEEHIKGAKKKVKNVNIQTAQTVLDIITLAGSKGILLGDWRSSKNQKNTIVQEMRNRGFGNLARYIAKKQTGAIDTLTRRGMIEKVLVKNSGRGTRPLYRLATSEVSNAEISEGLIRDLEL
ncbi:MAG: hypothetical protein CMM04_16990 [Rhodopirellula sp.]|nr:hypothetical protein [Rhodopirellula sp.]